MKRYFSKRPRLIHNIIRRSMILLSLLFILPIISCSATSEPVPNSTTAFFPVTTTSPEQHEIYQDFKYSVFRLDILSKEGLTVKQGTGYIIKDDGTFVTNAHVLADSWKAEAWFDETASSYEVEGIYYFDEDIDFAIGKLNIDDDFEPVPVEFTEDYNVGDNVYAIGYPNYALEAIVTDGEILSTYYTSDIFDMIYIRSTNYIRHGNSGGILASDDGKVLGMTSVSFSDSTYGSIRNIEYSDWQTNETEEPTPLEDYFHPSEQFELDKDTVEDYFTINISKTTITNDTENRNLIVDYEINVYPDMFLELIDPNKHIFIALVVYVDYYCKVPSSSELLHRTEEISLSFKLGGTFLTSNIEESIVIPYGIDDKITSVGYSYEIVYAEGGIIIYG